jgi:hypothetical protein
MSYLHAGHIYKFHTYDENLPTCAITFKEQIERAGRRVGRVVCVYDQDEVWMGTGFLVREDTVATARHVVKEWQEVNGTTVHLKSVYFTTRVHTTDFDPLHSGVYKCEPLASFVSTLPQYQRHYVLQDRFSMAPKITDDNWDHDNDFSFIRISEAYTLDHSFFFFFFFED